MIMFKQSDVLTAFICVLALCGTAAERKLKLQTTGSLSADVKIEESPVSIDKDRELIIAGTEATQGRYPYMVQINQGDTVMGTLVDKHLCGGQLIYPKIVLTAAHCLYNWEGFLEQSIQLVLGAHDLSKIDNDSSIEKFNIEVSSTSVKMHPSFNAESEGFDFALIYLDRESKHTPVQLKLDTSLPMENESLTMIGWGDTNANTDYDYWEGTNVLQQIEVDEISNKDCKDKYRSKQSITITNQMLCTQTIGKDFCFGDFGGPLIINGDEAAQDVLYGVASFAECGNPSFPGVYGRVSSVIEWLEENTNRPKRNPTTVEPELILVSDEDPTSTPSITPSTSRDPSIPPATSLTPSIPHSISLTPSSSPSSLTNTKNGKNGKGTQTKKGKGEKKGNGQNAAKKGNVQNGQIASKKGNGQNAAKKGDVQNGQIASKKGNGQNAEKIGKKKGKRKLG